MKTASESQYPVAEFVAITLFVSVIALVVDHSHERIMWSDEIFGWMLVTDPSLLMCSQPGAPEPMEVASSFTFLRACGLVYSGTQSWSAASSQLPELLRLQSSRSPLHDTSYAGRLHFPQ